jgi:hypothetical protein
MYPIDPKIAQSKGIRKYGFHGLSYSFIIRAVAEYLKKVCPLPYTESGMQVMYWGNELVGDTWIREMRWNTGIRK